VRVDEQPLLFFHFHGLKQITSWAYAPNLAGYKVRPSGIVLRSIYGPYIRMLSDITEQVSPLLQKLSLQHSTRSQMINVPPARHSPLPRLRVTRLIRLLDVFRCIFARDYILVINQHVI
jgi:hypothetical protein